MALSGRVEIVAVVIAILTVKGNPSTIHGLLFPWGSRSILLSVTRDRHYYPVYRSSSVQVIEGFPVRLERKNIQLEHFPASVNTNNKVYTNTFREDSSTAESNRSG